MTQLRLVTDDGSIPPTDRLPFPTEAVRTMVKERLSRLTTRVKPREPENPLDGLAANMEAALDRAQHQLDQLREDVDAFRIADYTNPERAA